MRPWIILGGLAMLLTACQQSALVRSPGIGEFVQLQGWTVVLQESLRVPAGKARVFIQDGEVRTGFDQYRPHCGFEITRVDHDGFRIDPDRFRISRVQLSLEQVVSSELLRVASLYPVFGRDSFGASAYHEGYHLWLVSEGQPQVMRMSCYGVYATPDELRPPSLREMRDVLGSIAEIRP